MSNQIAEFFPDMQEKDLTVIEKKAVEVYQDFDKKIAKAKENYGTLKILNLADKANYEQVKAAHILVKGIAADIEEEREKAKAPVLSLGRWIDGEAKRLQGDTVPLLAHLKAERDKYEAEEDRIKKEKQAAIDAKMRQRVDALKAVDSVIDFPAIVLMTDAHFDAHLKVETGKHEERQRQAAELARLQAEEAERKRKEEEVKAETQRLEREQLEHDRREMALAQALIKEQQEDIARQQKAIEDAKAAQRAEEEAKERKAREERIAAEAAERARIDAEAKAKREQAEREAKAEADRLEKIRMDEEARKQEDAKAKAEALRLAAIEAAKPDAEKWLQFAAVVRGLQLPTMATPKGEDVERLVKVNIENLAKLIDSEAQKLTK